MILSGCCSHHRCSSSIIPHSLNTLRGEEALTVALSHLFSLNVKTSGNQVNQLRWSRSVGVIGEAFGFISLYLQLFINGVIAV